MNLIEQKRSLVDYYYRKMSLGLSDELVYEDGFVYSVDTKNNDNVLLIDISRISDTDIIIPDVFDELDCITISNKYDNLRSIDFNNIRKFGAFTISTSIEVIISKYMEITPLAFCSLCDNLSKINLDNLRVVSEYSFYACNDLTEVNLRNVERIDKFAFYGSGVKKVYLEKLENLDFTAFADIEDLEFVFYNRSKDEVEELLKDRDDIKYSIISER
jgi:hypothetical protein